MVYDDYEPGQMADYYDDGFESDVEPLSEQIRQAEFESHGCKNYASYANGFILKNMFV